LVETVLALPASLKLDRGRPKPLLLDALGDRLPREIWIARRWASRFPWPLGCARGPRSWSTCASRTSGSSGRPSRRRGAPSPPAAATGPGPGLSSCSRASEPTGARGSRHERDAPARRRRRALGRHRPHRAAAPRRGPRALALPRPALLPDLARHLGALQ